MRPLHASLLVPVVIASAAFAYSVTARPLVQSTPATPALLPPTDIVNLNGSVTLASANDTASVYTVPTGRTLVVTNVEVYPQFLYQIPGSGVTAEFELLEARGSNPPVLKRASCFMGNAGGNWSNATGPDGPGYGGGAGEYVSSNLVGLVFGSGGNVLIRRLGSMPTCTYTITGFLI